MSGRCKQCNSVLHSYEMVWNPEVGEHNDTCFSCLKMEVEDSADQILDDMYLPDLVNTDEL